MNLQEIIDSVTKQKKVQLSTRLAPRTIEQMETGGRLLMKFANLKEPAAKAVVIELALDAYIDILTKQYHLLDEKEK